MKQHITIEQLNELSKTGKEKLRNWFGKFDTVFSDPYSSLLLTEKGFITIEGYPLLSIGQMIEFLNENAMGDLDLQIWVNNAGSSVWTGIGNQKNKLGGGEDFELCDAFWEAVKEVLNEKK